ncbi:MULTISPECIES: DUF3159 domain-containing protein [unclassified Mycolicibacterium]|uniref:DUF3159 domain-containing protein n=1 Tax=unclassified Mycolicibacterium TaxID=2636767 RepID=UPI00130D0BF9|nr:MULTISPECIES: DUF3159 domain-containing protein [unclassified Mycolicibacterium]MUL82571.1 DUF3159 domain-containing protein [Mycolicibacterium sp. CBMA 329]MUL88906.1 DUF3159 domain-containing protein [Mycolicibacterium sp. CBMA 331]MUL97475.1 DUF3159 domain-containing protein [Mycolicibacterium sp. CBMA 334]MUM26801.1 DUF3159 domain-containing protein [Mycolicibacterium sp. CBMA 295]MUM38422.1 DUF3159 domain-containing protein [Mycolicibacterium sp. CBMA 247]
MTDELTKEQIPTLLERIGGVSGLVYASLPTFAYVIVNAIAGLDTAVVISVGVSVGLIVLRLLRKQPIQPAVSGLLGVVVAALIAYCTGSAEDYFLPGIWLSLAMAAVFSVSLLVRRPLVGVMWNLLRSAGPDPSWRADTVALRAFDVATLAFVALFSARFIVQQWLYDGGFTGWLAFARIAMGYPLLGAVSAVVYWAVRRANRRIGPDIDRHSTGTGASDSPEPAVCP